MAKSRQVGVFIEHQPENSMALFNFTSVVLDEGTASAFGSSFCIADDGGGFSSHLAETRADGICSSILPRH
jgi:hypothetical protein